MELDPVIAMLETMTHALSRTDISTETTEDAATRAGSMAMIAAAAVVVIMFTAIWIGQLG